MVKGKQVAQTATTSVMSIKAFCEDMAQHMNPHFEEMYTNPAVRSRVTKDYERLVESLSLESRAKLNATGRNSVPFKNGR